MMSHPEDDVKPPSYETIMSNNETKDTMSDVPLPNILENGSPPPPAYYPPFPNQAWSSHSVTPPWSMDNIPPPNADSLPPFYQTFLKSKPKALGIVIIVAAIVEIALGIALGVIASSETIESGIPFWGPVFFINAGALTLTAQSRPRISLVKGSLSMSVISCIISIIAVILNVLDLAVIQCYYISTSNDYSNLNNANDDDNDYNGMNYGNHNNHGNQQSNHHNQHGDDRSSYQMPCLNLLEGVNAVLGLLLITNVLLFFVTLIISYFGFRSLSESRRNAPQIYVIPNDGAAKKSDAFPELACVPAQPPPYTANEVKATP